MREVVPGIAVVAVVLAHCPPLPLAQVRAPLAPGQVLFPRFLHACVLFGVCHISASLSLLHRSAPDDPSDFCSRLPSCSAAPQRFDFCSLMVPQVSAHTVPVMVSPLTVRVKFTCLDGRSRACPLKISVESSMCPSRISHPSLIGCPIRRLLSAPNNGVTLTTLCLPVTLVPSWASCSVIGPLPCRWLQVPSQVPATSGVAVPAVTPRLPTP
jgi:hypothetical protein